MRESFNKNDVTDFSDYFFSEHSINNPFVCYEI